MSSAGEGKVETGLAVFSTLSEVGGVGRSILIFGRWLCWAWAGRRQSTINLGGVFGVQSVYVRIRR